MFVEIPLVKRIIDPTIAHKIENGVIEKFLENVTSVAQKQKK